jgi:hypothetical protein
MMNLKSRIQLIGSLLSVGLILFGAWIFYGSFTSAKQGFGPAVGKVVSGQGQLMLRRQDSALWTTVRIGDGLHEFDQLFVASSSQATLEFFRAKTRTTVADQSLVVIRDFSPTEIESLSQLAKQSGQRLTEPPQVRAELPVQKFIYLSWPNESSIKMSELVFSWSTPLSPPFEVVFFKDADGSTELGRVESTAYFWQAGDQMPWGSETDFYWRVVKASAKVASPLRRLKISQPKSFDVRLERSNDGKVLAQWSGAYDSVHLDYTWNGVRKQKKTAVSPTILDPPEAWAAQGRVELSAHAKRGEEEFVVFEPVKLVWEDSLKAIRTGTATAPYSPIPSGACGSPVALRLPQNYSGSAVLIEEYSDGATYFSNFLEKMSFCPRRAGEVRLSWRPNSDLAVKSPPISIDFRYEPYAGGFLALLDLKKLLVSDGSIYDRIELELEGSPAITYDRMKFASGIPIEPVNVSRRARLRPLRQDGKPLGEWSLWRNIERSCEPTVLTGASMDWGLTSAKSVYLTTKSKPWIWLSWSKQNLEKGIYELQVSHSAEFTSVLKTEQTNELKYFLQLAPEPKTYFWRVRQLSEARKPFSDWSRPAAFEVIRSNAAAPSGASKPK